MTLTTYGSVAYQLKDANLEASGTCDFVCKALSIVNKTGKKTIRKNILFVYQLLIRKFLSLYYLQLSFSLIKRVIKKFCECELLARETISSRFFWWKQFLWTNCAGCRVCFRSGLSSATSKEKEIINTGNGTICLYTWRLGPRNYGVQTYTKETSCAKNLRFGSFKLFLELFLYIFLQLLSRWFSYVSLHFRS